MKNLQNLGANLTRNEMCQISGGNAAYRTEQCSQGGWCNGNYHCCVNFLQGNEYCCPNNSRCNGQGGCY